MVTAGFVAVMTALLSLGHTGAGHAVTTKAVPSATVAAPLTVTATWDALQPSDKENDSLYFDLQCDDNARLYGRSLVRVTGNGYPSHLFAGDAPITLPVEVLGSSTCSMRVNARAATVAVSVDGTPIATTPKPQFGGLAVRLENLKLTGPMTVALSLSRSAAPYRRDQPRPGDPGDREVAVNIDLDYSFPAPGTWSIKPTGCSSAHDQHDQSSVMAKTFALTGVVSSSGGAYVTDGAACMYAVNSVVGMDKTVVRVFRNGQPVDASSGSFTISMDSDVSITAFAAAIPRVPRKAAVAANQTSGTRQTDGKGKVCFKIVKRNGKAVSTRC